MQRLSAQVCWDCNHFEITTDFNSCLQGIKDTSGKWVVEPKYEQIYYHSRAHYIAGYGGKYGLIDTTGKILIPLQYDWLRDGLSSWFNHSLLFIVNVGDKLGVVDSANRTIVPVIYDEIFIFPDSTIAARLGKKEWYFYQIDGSSKLLPFKTKRRPWYLDRHRYGVSKRKQYDSKEGVIDDSCKIILPVKYTDISVYQETQSLRLMRKKKYGYCSYAGKMIWPIVFERDDEIFVSYSAGRGAQSVGMVGNGSAKFKGKYGMITITGDTILPFIYDYIEPYDYDLDADQKNIWLITKNGKHGMYRPGTGWVMDMEYDSILTVARFLSPSDSSTVGLVCALKNGKWGAQTTSGQQVLPYKFEDCYPYNNQSVFRLGDSLFCLSIIPRDIDAMLIGKMKQDSLRSAYIFSNSYHAHRILEIPANQQFAVEYGKNNAVVFYNPLHCGDTLETRDSLYVMTGKHDWGFHVNDRVLIASAFCVQPMVLEQRYSDSVSRFSFFPLREPDSSSFMKLTFFLYVDPLTGEKTMDVQDHTVVDSRYSYSLTFYSTVIRSDGKIISAASRNGYTHERFNEATGELFFIATNMAYETAILDTAGNVVVPFHRGMTGAFNRNYAWVTERGIYPIKWKLIDLRTNTSVMSKKSFSEADAPIWKHVTFTEDKKGVRLYSLAEKKTITPGFNSIAPLNKEAGFFAVKTCKGQMGAVDERGKQVIDTVWESYVPVEYITSTVTENEVNDFIGYNTKFYHYYVFYNDTGSVCFDALTGKILTDTEAYPILWKSSVTRALSDSLKQDRYFEPFRYGIPDVIKCDLEITQKDSVKFLPWQRQCILDSMYSPRRLEKQSGESTYPCDYCRSKGDFFFTFPFYWIKAYEDDGAIYRLSTLDDSLISFDSVNRYRYMRLIEPTRFNCSNVMLFPDGPHELMIDSLFVPASDWRNFIVNTVITYVNSHTGVEGDCHNPAAFPIMLKQSFLISAEGLKLYPPGFTEDSDQLVITVPWNELDSYLRKDIRTKLPLTP